MEDWHVWVIIGVILLIGEVFTFGFVLACFGAACFVSALLAFADYGVRMQLAAFSAGTLVLFFAIRPIFMLYMTGPAGRVRTNIDALVGKVGLVCEKIESRPNGGRVQVGGEDWKAVSIDETGIETGRKVVVMRVNGAKLLVRQLAEEEEPLR